MLESRDHSFLGSQDNDDNDSDHGYMNDLMLLCISCRQCGSKIYYRASAVRVCVT